MAAVGEVVAQRSGVLNIGLEGCMLVGAFFAMMATHGTGSPALGLAVGAGAGLVLSFIQGGLSVLLSADQVVVGTGANLLALGVTGSLFRDRFGQSGHLLSIPGLPSFHGVDAVTLLLGVSIPLCWWVLHRSSWGLCLRACGEYPRAVEAAGFSVASLRMQALACSGIFGGLGGAYLAIGVAGSFAENMTYGRGFVAIAMVTFGRWNPYLAVGAAFIVGFAESMQFTLQARNVAAPHQLLVATPYLIALVVLVAAGKGTRVPRALGVAYRKER